MADKSSPDRSNLDSSSNTSSNNNTIHSNATTDETNTNDDSETTLSSNTSSNNNTIHPNATTIETNTNDDSETTLSSKTSSNNNTIHPNATTVETNTKDNSATTLDPKSYNIFQYIDGHPQAKDKPVISGINWEGLPDLSDQLVATQFAKVIFHPSAYWKNKKTLYSTLNVFGSKTGFTPATMDSCSFGCNRAGAPRVRSVCGAPRTCTSGPLRVNCKWSFRFASVVKKYKKSNTYVTGTPIRNSFLDTDLVYITTKHPKFEHTSPCLPSATQVMHTNRTAGKYATSSDVSPDRVPCLKTSNTNTNANTNINTNINTNTNTNTNTSTNTTNQTKRKTIRSEPIAVNEIMQPLSVIAGKYGTCSHDVQMFVSETLILLKDVATNGADKDELDDHMATIIDKYKNISRSSRRRLH